MNSKNLFLLSVLLVELMLLSIQNTQALFADTAISFGNTFTASNEFPVSVTLTTTATSTPTSTLTLTPTPTVTPTITSGPSPTITPYILINEMFDHADNNDEWVEIFNNTSGEIDLSGWKISDALSEDIIPSTAPIPPGGYGGIVTNPTDVSGIPSSATVVSLSGSTIGSELNGDGDAVYLKNISNEIVDSMSYGNNSDVFSATAIDPSAGQSIARIPNGLDTDTSSDWQLDSSPSIGEANSL